METYRDRYEAHAQASSVNDTVGAGSWDRVGRIELEILKAFGLRPQSRMLDYGCGNGRLAVPVADYLDAGGRYVGVDVSRTFLDGARLNVAARSPRADFAWRECQGTSDFEGDERDFDVIACFSVYTHLLLEDCFNVLSFLRKRTQTGKHILSVNLLEDTEYAQHIFRQEAALPLETRFSGRVNNNTWSLDVIERVAQMAGWRRMAWIAADAGVWDIGGERAPLGQSVVVLRP